MILQGSEHRPGVQRVDMAVGVLISFTAVCLLGCGLGSGSSAGRRIECSNNLRQIGIALHEAHDKNERFPTESGSQPSFYKTILPFLDQTDPAVAKAVAGDQQAAIKLFLCPSRHTPANAVGKRDYGYAASNGTGSVGTSILDDPKGGELTPISNANGTAKTLLLAHVWMAPKTYTNGSDTTDLGWATKNNSRSINNAVKEDSDPSGSTAYIGGPHPHALPCLFADCHVQAIPYGFTQWAEMWAWDNKKPLTLPN
jgi:hypothetical protein